MKNIIAPIESLVTISISPLVTPHPVDLPKVNTKTTQTNKHAQKHKKKQTTGLGVRFSCSTTKSILS